ncbi:MAG: hypothetical protein LCH99_07910 [Proteobacteria bacterium]|nr:hypothetical protein [Pseudomonadota bacterium]
MTASEHDKIKDRAEVMLTGVAIIGARMGFDPERLIADLTGDSELGKFCRALLDLQSVALPAKRRGRPSDSDNRWQVFIHVERSRLHGLSIAEAIREYVKDTGGDNNAETRFANARKQYERSRAAWGELGLSMLFADTQK